MVTRIISGKALLVIERRDCEADRYETNAFGRWNLADDLGLIGDGLPGPGCVWRLKLQPGERVRVAVSFYLVYSTDYWGECDVDIEYRRCRVLRRQRAPKFYVSKKYRSP